MRAARHGLRRLSAVVENKGSVARDQLALERTMLAWLRTSLSFTGLGVALKQLQGPLPEGGSRMKQLRVAGRTVVIDSETAPSFFCFGVSGVLLAYSTARFLQAQAMLLRGYFPLGRAGFLLMIGTSAACTLGGVAMTVAQDLSTETGGGSEGAAARGEAGSVPASAA